MKYYDLKQNDLCQHQPVILKTETYQSELLHKIAHDGEIKEVPAHLLTRENLNKKDKKGYTPLTFCITTETLSDLPEAILEDQTIFQEKERTPGGQTYIHILAECAAYAKMEPDFHWKRLLENVENLSVQDKRKVTPMHILSRFGGINKLKPQFLIENPGLLKMADVIGETPLHYAAAKGRLKEYPSECLTHENLSIPDKKLDTPFHRAAWAGTIKQIPPRFLNLENLLNLRGQWEYNILEIVTQDKSNQMLLQQVPIHILAAYKPRNTEQKEKLREILENNPKVVRKLRDFKTKKAITKAQTTFQIA